MKLNPTDTTAAALLKDAEKRRDALKADEVAAKQRAEKYNGFLKQGKDALAANKYDESITALNEAPNEAPAVVDLRIL